MVYLHWIYHFKFFKGCPPQTLFGPGLNIFSYLLQYINITDVAMFMLMSRFSAEEM